MADDKLPVVDPVVLTPAQANDLLEGMHEVTKTVADLATRVEKLEQARSSGGVADLRAKVTQESQTSLERDKALSETIVAVTKRLESFEGKLDKNNETTDQIADAVAISVKGVGKWLRDNPTLVVLFTGALIKFFEWLPHFFVSH